MMHQTATLPVEVWEHVFDYLDTPQDLLHAALSCKTFYKIIIPTYRLHFTNIRCSFKDTPSNSVFWQTLSTSPRFCSMIRIFDGSTIPSRKPLFKMEEKFVSKWTGSTAHHSPRARIEATNFQCLLRCLEIFRGCRSIHFREVRFSCNEITELVACILANLSDNLDSLVLDFTARTTDCVSRYVVFPENISFSHLTTFSFLISFRLDLKQLLNSLLDSLVYGCFTLVRFKLCLWFDSSTQPGHSFNYPRLIEDARWPSLRRFELVGKIKLFLESESEKEKLDLLMSFVARHSRLERLRLWRLHSDVEEIFRNPRPYHALPHLSSLNFDFPIHLDVLPLIYHVSHPELKINDINTFPLARSLRSLAIVVYRNTTESILEEIVKTSPQLERLCMNIGESPSEHCYSHGCQCIDRYGGSDCIANLRNLTHFGLFTYHHRFLGQVDQTVEMFRNLASDLPRLSHVYRLDEKKLRREYEVIRRPDNFIDLVPTLQKHLDPDLAWDFSLG